MESIVPLAMVDPKGKAVEVPDSKPHKKRKKSLCRGNAQKGEVTGFCHVYREDNQGKPHPLFIVVGLCALI